MQTLTDRAAAAQAVAARYGIVSPQPHILNDLFSVIIHLEPAPVVARVSTRMRKLYHPIEPMIATELAVTTWPADTGFPVVRSSDLLPPGPHVEDGFAISFWTWLDPVPEASVDAAQCLALLPDLHAARPISIGSSSIVGCMELRTLEVVTALIAFVPELGHEEGWMEAIHGMTASLPPV